MLEENILAYEIAVNEILDEEDPKTLRYLILEYNLSVKNKLLDSFELYQEYENVRNNSDKIEIINKMIKEIIKISYSPRYIYSFLAKFSRNLKESIRRTKASENLVIYKKVFDEIKDECRQIKA